MASGEKTQAAVVAVDGGEALQDVAPVELAWAQQRNTAARPFGELQAAVDQALNDARALSSGERRNELRVLDEALGALGESADPEASAAYLLQKLELQAFHGLEEERGWTMRASAVEALLALGFPHALKVAPEDLAHLREVQARGPRTRRPLWNASLTGASLSMVAWTALLLALGRGELEVPLVMGWAGAALAAFAGRVGKWLGLPVLALAGLVSLVMADSLSSGAPLLLVGAPVVAAGTFLLRKPRAPNPGRTRRP